MSSAGNIYQHLQFPEAPADRPYVYIDMVATIDGKTVSGNRGDDVMDLGSNVDHALMRRIQDQSDAAMVGATTLRAADAMWDPKTAFRVVVSNSGQFDYRRPFFSSGGQAFVACSESSKVEVTNGVHRLEAGKDQVDFRSLLAKLREMGARHLLCFGGSELNAQMLSQDLVDELFLTIAPKVKLGRDLPTYAGGDPLPREHLLNFNLLEHHVVGDDVFLRYKRRTDAS